MKKREPTDEEKILWNEHTKADKKLKKNKPIPTAPAKAPSPPAPRKSLPPKPSPQRTTKDLALGDTSHIDGRNADRFRKGKTATDATLDLHGLSRDAAFAAFHDFILRCHESGKRRLLVITGKGRGGEPGVLKQALSGWINDGAVRSHILAYDTAQPRHGGGGAFYILLKKRV